MEMSSHINRIRRKEDLSDVEIEDVMRQIMTGAVPPQEIADFLLALRAKGPSIGEITGAARLLRQFSVPVRTRHPVVLDTCGTGGDKRDTFNISTATAIVASAAGAVVAKHGNRSVSSRCGSACVLESLGVNLNAGTRVLERCLDEEGIAFLFAPKLHPAMKNVVEVRKSLGVETIFNILGPLINPASATHQFMGVYRRDLVEPIARVLKNLGLTRAMVVHGADGLDEVTTCGVTAVSEFDGEKVVSYDIEPGDFSLAPAHPSDLRGGDIVANARIISSILDGEKSPKRDIVLFNAGCALYTVGLAADIRQGIGQAAQAVDSGRARAKLGALRRITNEE